MNNVLLAVLACGLVLPCDSHGASTIVPLSRDNMQVQTHLHAVGFNVSGTYQKLSGTLSFDPAGKTCAVDVTFEVRSLALPNSFVQSRTMSREFLDPDTYPQTRYVGSCQGNVLVGNLTLRGQTHPFNMSVAYDVVGGRLVAMHARGAFNRFEWGVAGSSITVGKTIEVTNDISLDERPSAAP